jgi:hypothetical protein
MSDYEQLNNKFLGQTQKENQQVNKKFRFEKQIFLSVY